MNATSINTKPCTVIAIALALASLYGCMTPTDSEDQDITVPCSTVSGRSCNDSCETDPPIDNFTACQNQGTLWCYTAGFGLDAHSGCTTAYINQCFGSHPIAACDQQRCINAIVHNAVPGDYPAQCVGLFTN